MIAHALPFHALMLQAADLLTEHVFSKVLDCVCLGSLEWGISTSSSKEGQGTSLLFSCGSETFRDVKDQETESRAPFSN